MNKIIIIGIPGAGKTTFSVELGAMLHIPVHHLDKIFWKQNWTSLKQDEFRKVQNELMGEDRWIIDGNFTKSIDQRIILADTVIYFDFPRSIALWRTLRRYFRYFGKVRPNMGGNNVESLKWKSIKFILMYPSNDVRNLLNQHADKKIFIFRNTSDVAVFMERVKELPGVSSVEVIL